MWERGRPFPFDEKVIDRMNVLAERVRPEFCHTQRQPKSYPG